MPLNKETKPNKNNLNWKKNPDGCGCPEQDAVVSFPIVLNFDSPNAMSTYNCLTVDFVTETIVLKINKYTSSNIFLNQR